MHTFVVKLADLAFLSDEDLAAHGDLGGKIIRQFSFLPGDLKVTISDGLAHIEYSPAPPDKLAEALRLADQGAKAAKKGDFHAALELYTAALQANPALPDTRRELAMVHYELGQLDAAKDELIDALRLAPDDAWSHVVMGNIFTRQQDWTSAIRFFSKALDLKLGDPYALNGLGAAHAKSGQLDQAITAFDAAISANPKMPEPRFGKALALQRQGRLHPAADTLQALIDTASSNSPIIDQSKKLLAAIESEIREQGGPTNSELLQEKHPAAVWHLLDALKRFENLDARRVAEITFEVARLGEKGLDYSSPEQKYRLTAYPEESFSGLQLMCLMYAGFKRIAPDQDTGMDLNEPWLTALGLFNSGKSS
jgi:tetratricopeptide (TPR) repeat protein